MKLIAIACFLMAAIAGHGQQLSIQFDTTWPGFSCRFIPDGFRVCDGTPEGKILVYLIDRIDSLQKRVDGLEKRPYFQLGQWPGGIQYDPGGQIDPGFWQWPRNDTPHLQIWDTAALRRYILANGNDTTCVPKRIILGSPDGSIRISFDTTWYAPTKALITPKKKKKK